MKLAQAGKKISIELQGKAASPYSIFSTGLFLLLISLIIFFAIRWAHNPVVAMGVSFLPLVLLVFLFKIIIWNFVGKETIILGKTDMRVFYDYKVIYKKVIKTFNFKKYKIHCISNVTGDQLLLQDVTGHEKGIFKLKFVMDKNQEYISAMNVTKEELIEIKKLVGA